MSGLRRWEAGALRRLAALISRRRLTVLYYHRVLAKPDPLRPDEVYMHQFAAQMDALATVFTVLHLGDALKRLVSGSLPPRSVAITFDDGYADNVDLALPILMAKGLPATFFIATGFIDGGIMWNDKVIEAVRRVPGSKLDLRAMGLDTYQIGSLDERCAAVDRILRSLKYLPGENRNLTVEAICQNLDFSPAASLMMGSRELLKLSRAEMEIGAHTISHPILVQLSDRDAQSEISGSRQWLEDVVGRKVALFAYPNGVPKKDYDERHAGMVMEAGYEAAVSTQWGCAGNNIDLMQVPRIAPWDKDLSRFCLRVINSYSSPVSGIRRQVTTAGRLAD